MDEQSEIKDIQESLARIHRNLAYFRHDRKFGRRISKLEDSVYKVGVLGGAAMLGIAIVAGATWIQMPHIASDAVKENLPKNIVQEIEAYRERAKIAAAEAETTLGQLISSGKSWTDDESNWIQIGDTLVCWGSSEAKREIVTDKKSREDKYTYEFDFTFEKEFAGIPTVTDSVRTHSNGESYNLYRHSLTSRKFSGVLIGKNPTVEGLGASKDENERVPLVVSMSYVAIGKPK